MSTSSQVHEDRARKYAKASRFLEITGFLMGIFYLFVYLSTSLGEVLEDLAHAAADRWAAGHWGVAVVVFQLLVGLGFLFFTFPFRWMRSYKLEREYGLSTQSLDAWLLDQVKVLGLQAVLGGGLGLVAYGALRWRPELWWLPVFGVLVGLSLVFGLLGPTLLLRFFYDLDPVTEGPLKTRLESLCREEGIEVVDLFRIDLSRRSRKANAAMAGLGRMKRVLLGDTLLASFPAEEVETVLAHEIAHRRLHHIPKLLVVGWMATLFELLVATVVYLRVAPHLGFAPNQLIGLPVLALLIGMAALGISPLKNLLSRRYEYAADRFAAAKCSAETMISALRRLAEQNLAPSEPDTKLWWWAASHPPVSHRIAALAASKEESNPAESG